jgi:hypothetical protein
MPAEWQQANNEEVRVAIANSPLNDLGTPDCSTTVGYLTGKRT